jgi:hypothetical protein
VAGEAPGQGVHHEAAVAHLSAAKTRAPAANAAGEQTAVRGVGGGAYRAAGRVIRPWCVGVVVLAFSCAVRTSKRGRRVCARDAYPRPRHEGGGAGGGASLPHGCARISSLASHELEGYSMSTRSPDNLFAEVARSVSVSAWWQGKMSLASSGQTWESLEQPGPSQRCHRWARGVSVCSLDYRRHHSRAAGSSA